MEIDCIGLFVNNMETMVKFYRDVIGLKTNWNGEPNADFEAGKCRLIMFGRNDFENMVSKPFAYPKGLNGTMEIDFNLKTYDDVDKEYKRLMDLGVETVFPPTTMPWGQRTCYIADPEGIYWKSVHSRHNMASDLDYVQYVIDQIKTDGTITYKKMFGEYLIYSNNKPVVMVCDNTAFVKMLDCIKPLMENAETGFSYDGAKECYIANVDNSEHLSNVVMILEKNVPIPKKK